MNRLLLTIVVLLASMFAAVLYYRTQYQQAEQARQQFEKEVDAQQGVMKQLSQQIQAVSALDTKHSRELEHDKKLITQLEWDVAATSYSQV